jgi:4-diphosphocytidyl-2-C-methyl-D-erythritol kinase
MFEEKASAKVNLCLQIVGQKSNGFHLLDSIVGFTEFGDHLSFEKKREAGAHCDGCFF